MRYLTLTLSLLLGLATSVSADTRIVCTCSQTLFFGDESEVMSCSDAFSVTFNENSVLKTSNNHPCDEVIANRVTQDELFFVCNVDMIDVKGEEVWYSLTINRISGDYSFWQNSMSMMRNGSCKKASNAF